MEGIVGLVIIGVIIWVGFKIIPKLFRMLWFLVLFGGALFLFLSWEYLKIQTGLTPVFAVVAAVVAAWAWAKRKR